MTNKTLLIESLRELSDRATQHRLWESTGEGGAQVSSFTEAVEGIFTDSGLTPDLERRTTGLGSVVEEALLSLDAAVSKVERELRPAALIESREMDAVRHLAGVALELLGSR